MLLTRGDNMTIQRRWLIEILKGIAFAFAAIGFVANLLTKRIPFSTTISIIVISIIALIYFAITIWGEKNQQQSHRFDKNSPSEAKYFLKWYSQSGTLRIFCTDLLWLEDNPKILNALSEKGDTLHLYLRDHKDYIVNRLFNAGAHVYKVKEKIKSSHRFSILNDDGIKSIIIRNKETEEAHRIEIQEFRDHAAFYYLAADMLDDCYESVYHKSTNATIE
jgi:hypothetical protein